MKYPKNDLWSVRQIEFLQDALDGYENLEVNFYPNARFQFEVPGIETYDYLSILYFPGKDRTIVLEQGADYGLSTQDVLRYLDSKSIKVNLVN